MQEQKYDFYDIKVCAALMIDKIISNTIDEEEYVKQIQTYVAYVDKLYIYNITNQDISSLLDKLKKYNNIYYTHIKDYGEVLNYQYIMEDFIEEKADFGVILTLGYYYEEGAFLYIRRYLVENNHSKIAIATPMPLRGCELFSAQVEQTRPCKGCNLVGTFINIDIFKELSPFKIEYYQSMFDYEYCLRARLKGYKLLLFQNQVLRNENYSIIERKILFMSLPMYDYDLMDLYYQTRNRYYLWEEYEKLDPEYVKLDKKLFKKEKQVLKIRDKNYREKLYMIEEARYDYLKKIKGKYKGGEDFEKNI